MRIAIKVSGFGGDDKFLRVIKGTGNRGYYFGGQYRLSPAEIMAMDYEVFTVDKIEDGKE